jgi:hypothetical protein
MRSADRKYPDLEPYYREFEKDEARKCLRRDAGACVITVAAICLTWASGLPQAIGESFSRKLHRSVEQVNVTTVDRSQISFMDFARQRGINYLLERSQP